MMNNSIQSRRERERQAHAAEIVAAAEKVFGRKGFDEASVDEIAKEAQFTRRTVYQYFVTKEDLYFAVITKGFRTLDSYFDESRAIPGNGYQKIQRAGWVYYRFYQDFPDIFRLMNYIGYIRKRAAGSSELAEFLKVDDQLFRELTAVIREGQADGSIRGDLDAERAGYSLVFVLTGFFYQLAAAGRNFATHRALDEADFVRATLELICQGFRA